MPGIFFWLCVCVGGGGGVGSGEGGLITGRIFCLNVDGHVRGGASKRGRWEGGL